MITQQQRINRPPGFGQKADDSDDLSPQASPTFRVRKKISVPDFRKSFSRSISLNDAAYQVERQTDLYSFVEEEPRTRSISAVDAVNRRVSETYKMIGRSTSVTSLNTLSPEDCAASFKKRRSSWSVHEDDLESFDGSNSEEEKTKSEEDDVGILDVSCQFAKCKRPTHPKQPCSISEEHPKENSRAHQNPSSRKKVGSHWDKVQLANVINIADDLEKDCDFVCRSEEERMKMAKKTQETVISNNEIENPYKRAHNPKPNSNKHHRKDRKVSSFCGYEDCQKTDGRDIYNLPKSINRQRVVHGQRRRIHSSSETNFQRQPNEDIHNYKQEPDAPNLPGIRKGKYSTQEKLPQLQIEYNSPGSEDTGQGSLATAKDHSALIQTVILSGQIQSFTPPTSKRVRFAETRGRNGQDIFRQKGSDAPRRASLSCKATFSELNRRRSSHEFQKQTTDINTIDTLKTFLPSNKVQQEVRESDGETTDNTEGNDEEMGLLNNEVQSERKNSSLDGIQMKLRDLFRFGPLQDESNSFPDEVMEEGCLSVRDVSDLLHAQYFILTGGRSREGWPILTFPDRGNFNYLGDEDYKRLIVYLTQLPPLQEVDKGFVLVVDRRQDKWNAVKNVLLKVSGFFPGLIHVAYVLRPLGFLQKAISEVSNKFFREEFKFRVVVCNCVEDLHHHIDKSQLPQELGGLIPYHHEEWMEQRLAVEKFSNNASEISASLKRFTQLLQDTELPNDVATTQHILSRQSNEYKDIKSELSTAAQHGDTLLQCIRRSTGGPHNILNITAIERLLVQLEETEAGFDGFWEKHEDRLQQCLQLRHFQEKFKDMQMILDNRLEDLVRMPEVAESVAAVDALIQEAKQFELTVQEDCESAQKLMEQGKSLIINKHYAVDCIEPKVSELLRVTTTLTDKIQRRLQILSTLRELQQRVEAAEKWCGAGVDLLSGQHLEHCATPDFAELALRDIQAFLESAPSLTSESLAHLVTPNTSPLVQQVLKRIEDLTQLCERRRVNLTKVAARPPRPVQPVEPVTQQTLLLQTENDGGYDAEVHDHKLMRVIGELLETERAYVSELSSVLTGYRNELMGPIDLNLKVDDIFGNLEQLVGFHRDTLLPRLLACHYDPAAIAKTFLMQSGRLHSLYATYCQNHPSSERLLQEHGNHPVLLECQHNLGHRLPLSAYLLKPVQRVTKYQLLLKDLMKSTEEEETVRILGDAVECMLTVLKHVNDSMHQTAITGYPNRISDLGHLLLSGTFRVWMSHKKDKLRDLRLSPKTRKVFLFEKALLFCKQEGQGDQSLCHFKHCLQMSEVGLTEAVGGTGRSDGRRFEVWLPGRQEVTTLQASTPSIKEEWVKQIKQLLISQLHRLRASTARPVALGRRTQRLRSVDSGIRGSALRRSAEDLEVAGWSSECSCSEDEAAEVEPGSRWVCVMDYKALADAELTMQDGDLMEVVRPGTAGWWLVRKAGSKRCGWVPACYLERQLKRHSRSCMSVCSLDSGMGLRRTPSRASISSVSGSSQDAMSGPT